MTPTALLWSSSEKQKAWRCSPQPKEGSPTQTWPATFGAASIGRAEDDTRTRTNLHSCFGIPAPNGRKPADMWTTWRHTGRWESAPPRSWASSAEEENRPCPTSRLEEDQSPVYTKGASASFFHVWGKEAECRQPRFGSPFYDWSPLYGFTIRFSKRMCRNLTSWLVPLIQVPVSSWNQVTCSDVAKPGGASERKENRNRSASVGEGDFHRRTAPLTSHYNRQRMKSHPGTCYGTKMKKRPKTVNMYPVNTEAQLLRLPSANRLQTCTQNTIRCKQERRPAKMT